MRATSSPDAGRRHLTAMAWRLGGRFLFEYPRGKQVQTGPHLSAGHHRIRAAPWPRGALAVGTHQHHERAAHLVERPGGGPAEGAAISVVLGARTGVRPMLWRLVAAVSRLSATIPRAASRRPTSPLPASRLRAGLMWCRARRQRACEGCGWQGMQEVIGR